MINHFLAWLNAIYIKPAQVTTGATIDTEPKIETIKEINVSDITASAIQLSQSPSRWYRLRCLLWTWPKRNSINSSLSLSTALKFLAQRLKPISSRSKKNIVN